MTYLTSPHPCRPSGFTLVELMVAMAIGLFLMLGISQVFLASKKTYNLQAATSLMQENGRFAVEMLQREINQAGFNTSSSPMRPFVDTPAPDCVNKGNVFSQDCAGTGDAIAIQYESATDCLGQATPVVAPFGVPTAINVYYVDDPDGDGLPSLMCRGNGGVNAEAIVDGIEALQVTYGEDIPAVAAATSDGIADVYRNATNVTDFLDVVAVRLALLAHSIEPAGITDNNVYPLLDAAPVGPFNDALRREVYQATVIRRNKG